MHAIIYTGINIILNAGPVFGRLDNISEKLENEKNFLIVIN